MQSVITGAVKSKATSAFQSATSDKAPGYLGGYCSNNREYCFGQRIGNVVRLSLLCSMLFFLFIALAVNKLSVDVLNDCDCGWKEYSGNSVCSQSDYSDKQKSAGEGYVAFGIISFFYMVIMIPLVVAIDAPFAFLSSDLARKINFFNLVGLWVCITICFGSWTGMNDADSNPCRSDGKIGPSISLVLFIWILHYVYVLFSFETIEEILWGEK